MAIDPRKWAALFAGVMLFVLGCGSEIIVDKGEEGDQDALVEPGQDTPGHGGGKDSLPAGAYTVDTALDTDTIKAGDSVEARCTVTDEDGNEVETDVAVQVMPGEGLDVAGVEVTGKTAGLYSVACIAPDLGIVDEEPEPLTVLPGDPAKVKAFLDESLPMDGMAHVLVAGQQTEVVCEVTDAYGNEVNIETTVDEGDGYDVTAKVILGTTVGKYKVYCSVEGYDEETYTKVNDILQIVHGDPVALELSVTPDKANYKVNEKIYFSWVVLDQFGNEIDGLGVTLQGPAEGMNDLGTNDDGNPLWSFGHEGIFTFAATLDDDTAVSDTVELMCDESPPTIVVEFPERGATFDGDPEIVVQGYVYDEGSGVKTLKINKSVVSLGSGGEFYYPIDSVHGLNEYVIEAWDNINNQAKRVGGWYYSTDWVYFYDEMSLEDVIVQDGALVLLGQDLMDDGDHDPTHPDDLATLMEILLGQIDFASLVTSFGALEFPLPGLVNLTLLDILGFEIGLTGDLIIGVEILELDMNAPTISLDCRDGGIDASIGFNGTTADPGLNLSLRLSIELDLFAGVIGTDYGIGINPSFETQSSASVETISVKTSFDVAMPPGGELSVETNDLDLEYSGVDIDPIEDLVVDLGNFTIPELGIDVELPELNLSQIVGPINDILSDWVLNPLLDYVMPFIINLLEPVVEMFAGDLIEQVIGLLAINTVIPIPAIVQGMPEVDLGLHTALSSVVFTELGGQVGLSLGFLTDKLIDRNPLGSIKRDACMGTDPAADMMLDPTPPAQIGAKYDMVNELIYAFWWAGVLNLDIGEEMLGGLMGGGGMGDIPVENLAIQTEFLLPPILDDCNTKQLQEFQVGDLWLVAQFDFLGSPQEVGFWMELKINGGIIAANTSIGFSLKGITLMEYEFIDIKGNLGSFAGIIESLIPMLKDLVKDQEFTFEVPPIDLSSLIGGAIPGFPAGVVLQLGDLAAMHKKGYVLVGGDLQ